MTTASELAHPPVTSSARYSSVAILLHWVIALALALQIGFGWYMGDLEDKAAAKQIEAVHISVGLTILLLVVVRLVWAFVRRPPPSEPAAPLERLAAVLVHKLLYLLMLAIPLSGWFMESLGRKPLLFWGADWPKLPVTGLLQGQDLRAIKETVEGLHGSPLVWALIGLVALHTAGAIKHQFDGSPVLWRMLPRVRRPR